MLNKFVTVTKQAAADRKGVTALEYGLIAAALAVGVIGAFSGLFGRLVTALGGFTF
ncbi:Flp family type IVb pilin [Falsiroseomonas tokyonensis]|uniref:Flp family type IVb pilin n=1 Tax=Falsiroseomonas tokyonensis TaxID=430521 RepID=A0ABV7BP35_9PROT|nr:Flp family type IVb pilin [Falsiroseomonas tokyonensis]MBU8537349.1 Flp family type IVb pilin [Falsiroseomonas tokyonensis]